MTDSPTDVYGDRGAYTDYRGKPISYEPCERISVCCGAPVDETGTCGNCREHNGATCSVHEGLWDEGECQR